MELLEGATLRHRIGGKPLPIDHLLGLAIQIADGLETAHLAGRKEAARRASEYGIRSLPAVVIDGKLASCCAGRGVEERVLQEALR
jgi:hypothetical protein